MWSWIGVVAAVVGVCITCTTSSSLSAQSYGDFDFEVLPFASYELRMRGKTWLRSVPAFLNANDMRYSIADGSLKYVRNETGSGRDAHGAWRSVEMEYSAGSNGRLMTVLKMYDDEPFVVFEQHFPDLLEGTSIGNPNYVLSGFPRVRVGGQDDGVELGYINYGGMMVGDTTKWMGRWNNETVNLRDGLAGGPLALFDHDGHVVVMSSFTEFMATSSQHDDLIGGSMSWGIMGSVTQVPAHYVTKIIWYFSSDGINEAFSGWGEVLRREHGRTDVFVESDLVNNYLGYWMDNGSYYYYNTEKGMNYEQTIYAIHDYADAMKIPYRYIQYDSWWYYEGPLMGVLKWEGRPDIFPNGMITVHNRTGWPVVAHNRWWSSKTPYAKQNGGKFNFLVEKLKAAPLDEEFWYWLFVESKRWGLTTYEQDWMNVELIGLDAFKTDIALGKTWLVLMAKAAAKAGITLQYCMSNPRHAMQALQLNVVTQARVSDDYSPGRGTWKIGVTNIFAHALGLAPYKDTFWSSRVQPPFGQQETWPALHALAATLSTGPVGPGDGIGLANVSLIMRCCNKDGLILKPNAPIKAVDAQILQAAFHDGTGPDGEVWSTFSEVSGLRFGILLAAAMTPGSRLIITPSQAGFRQKAYGNMMAYQTLSSTPTPGQTLSSTPTPGQAFSDRHPLTLVGCTNDAFCLYHTSPLVKFRGASLLLYGEISKWVPMSAKRISNISISNDDVLIALRGAVNEEVVFWFALNGIPSSVSCVMSASGEARISIAQGQCVE